jgi:putative methyltransferase (TIGR04325 family)
MTKPGWRYFGITYTGVYGSFEEVRRAHPSTPYHNDDSEQSEIAITKAKVQRFAEGLPPSDEPGLARLNVAPLFISGLPQTEVHVLDIGGGTGATWLDLTYSCTGKKVSLTVFDLPEMVEIGSDVLGRFPEITLTSEMPMEGSFDIAHIGAALQYFEDYRGLLAQVAKLAPEYIIIADTTMGDAPTFAAAQVNMFPRIIPRWVFNRDEVVGLLAGYDLIHRSINHSGPHNFANYPLPQSGSHHWNLILKRSPH